MLIYTSRFISLYIYYIHTRTCKQMEYSLPFNDYIRRMFEFAKKSDMLLSFIVLQLRSVPYRWKIFCFDFFVREEHCKWVHVEINKFIAGKTVICWKIFVLYSGETRISKDDHTSLLSLESVLHPSYLQLASKVSPATYCRGKKN